MPSTHWQLHSGAGWWTNVCIQKYQHWSVAFWSPLVSVSSDRHRSCRLNHAWAPLWRDWCCTDWASHRFWWPALQMLCERQCKWSGHNHAWFTNHGRLHDLLITRHSHYSKRGLPDNIETYGLISGLWTSTFALGAFVGPSVSGALFDSIGFRKATIFVIACHSIVACILIIILALERKPQPYKELASTESLIKNHDGLFYNDKK